MFGVFLRVWTIGFERVKAGLGGLYVFLILSFIVVVLGIVLLIRLFMA